MAAQSKTPSLNRCVVVVNPSSTHYVRGQRFIEQLRNHFEVDRFEVIEISKRDYQDEHRLLDRLSGKLGDQTLLGVAGGDGTVSLIVNLLLTCPGLSAAARRTVILPLWGGNANDLAYMVNGPFWKAKLPQLLQQGRVVPIRPLAVTVKHDGQTDIKLAVCYASFGASANAARNVSRPAHRYRPIYRLTGARLATDFASVTRSLLSSKAFLSETNGRTQPLYDLILINGSRIARVNRVGSGNLTEPTFYMIRVQRKHPIVGLYLAHIARGAAFRHATQTQLTFSLRQATWAQWDGEAQLVAADSEINVQSYDQPFYVLSTKLKV